MPNQKVGRLYRQEQRAICVTLIVTFTAQLLSKSVNKSPQLQVSTAYLLILSVNKSLLLHVFIQYNSC